MFNRRVWLVCVGMVWAGLSLPLQAQNKKKSDDLLAIPDVPRDQVIGFTLYTVSNRVLKMTAQLYPLKEGEDRRVRLEVKRDKLWFQVAETQVIEDGWTAHFRVEKWDDAQDASYRVAHGDKAFYQGLIRRNPVEKESLVVAGFTGNSIYPGHGGDIDRSDIVANIKKIDPDVLFFSGDQVYDHKRHYPYWLKFGRDFGDIMRDRPTVTIPDDHDVGQPNLWGAGGKKSNKPAGDDGGYVMPAEYVKQVERAQTWHLPDPYDATPVERGIGVYYTELRWGRVSFAILEDRKWKTGPDGVIPKMGPRPDHILDPAYDPKTVDVPGAVLLGERQHKFLDHWGQDWTDADFKVALSQTIFCGGAHIHGKIGGRLHADLDSNGWPQTGRNQALGLLRKCFAFHYAGDQHLATIFHHGIEDWGDAGYSFCVPSIANLYLRWWKPVQADANRPAGMPDYTGNQLDGFGNRVTCYAAANPDEGDMGGDKLSTRAAGFGVARFDKKTRQITMECWPRMIDVGHPEAKQYPGWPMTINQQDNYGRKAVAWLPLIEVSGRNDPVIQVVDESNGEWIYTLRIKGGTFRPKVFREGAYTVHVGEGAARKTIQGVKSVQAGSEERLKVQF